MLTFAITKLILRMINRVIVLALILPMDAKERKWWLPTNQRAQNQTAIQTTLPPPAAPPPLAAIFNALRKLDHRLWPSTKTRVRPETFIFNQIAPRSPATNSSSIHPDRPQEHNFKINFAFNFIALLFCMGKFQFCTPLLIETRTLM